MHRKPHSRRRQGQTVGGPAGRPDAWRRPAHNVPVNVAEYDDRYVMHVYCVGFAREGIEVTVTGDTLYVAGRREPAEDPEFLLQEFPIRRFERAFELSEHADRAATTARLTEAGVLEVTVPKLASAQRPDVRVEVG